MGMGRRQTPRIRRCSGPGRKCSDGPFAGGDDDIDEAERRRRRRAWSAPSSVRRGGTTGPASWSNQRSPVSRRGGVISAAILMLRESRLGG